MEIYNQVIFKSRYARYRDDVGRREEWQETVNRYVDSVIAPVITDKATVEELRAAISNLNVVPSMRALMTAGKALDRDNVAGYNCSYLPIDHPRAFDEVMYILMCGTGVGFSVERQEIAKLPAVAEEMHDTDSIISVGDSKIGWASAYRELISLLYAGKIPKWDLSKVRPAGERLKVFGGRSSGPKPLEDLFKFTVSVFKKAVGRKMTSLEIHDIVCKIADVVVVGGVRRSALISLSNLTDERMRNAKNGQWWLEDGQRALANNSVAYTEKPDVGIFLKEWHTLYESRSGERGIFNRVAATRQSLKSGRRETKQGDEPISYGTNPCGEIILRPNGFCNLSEVIARPTDGPEALANKVRLATILGTVQSTYTDFRYLRSVWRRNAEEERLLGVSITGIMDNELLYQDINNISGSNTPMVKLADTLEKLREVAVQTNKEWAYKLGINQSAAITCVKPSGTVSQLAGCSSGIHPSYSDYYVRTIRADVRDPLCSFLKKVGVPWEADVMKPDNTVVFSFPQKSPGTSVNRTAVSAIEQLELALVYKNSWCEHNPSITVYVREHEWMQVGAWVYDHFDDVVGIAFLPYSDHVYAQAPYQEVSKEEYESLLAKMPKAIDWSEMKEVQDNTTGSQELACAGGVCEVT
jgi:ribonucleoside-diphosphate reductase alpha chain